MCVAGRAARPGARPPPPHPPLHPLSSHCDRGARPRCGQQHDQGESQEHQ